MSYLEEKLVDSPKRKLPLGILGCLDHTDYFVSLLCHSQTGVNMFQRRCRRETPPSSHGSARWQCAGE